MIFKKYYFVIIIFSLLLGSCKDDDPKPEKELPFRTVLIYLAANNDLFNDAYNSIEQIEQNIEEVDGNLIVYARLPGENPALYHISNSKGKRQKQKIKEYSVHNSSDPTVLRQVINEVKNLYEAKTYGLILWSHATGWVPQDVGPIKLRSFGNDDGDRMDIKELNTAIPSNLFDFVMFDACSMASVEVLYEIKDKAKYFIASPGEVVSSGMPYDKMVNDLFGKDKQAYFNLARKYFEYYNSLSGYSQSATISVIEASKLSNIANLTKKTLEEQEPLFPDFNRDQIQRMDFDRFNNPLIAFDFIDFVETNYNNTYLNLLKSAVTEAVIYQAHTAKFNGFEINKFSGLTCYIPHEENEEVVHSYYRTLKWYSESGFNTLF